MRVQIRHWVGGELKLPGFDCAPAAEYREFDITADDLLRFYAAGYDVMLKHPHRERLDCLPPTEAKAVGRKQRRALRTSPCKCQPRTVWLDDAGRRFRQR